MIVNVNPAYYNSNRASTGNALMSFPMSAKQQHVAHRHLENIVAQLVRIMEETGKAPNMQCKVVTALKQQLTECLGDTPEGRAIAAEMDRVMHTLTEGMSRHMSACVETEKSKASCAYLRHNSTNEKGYYVTTTTSPDKLAAGSYSMTLRPSTGSYTTTTTKNGRLNYQLTEEEISQAQKNMSAVYTALAGELGEDEAHKVLTQAVRQAESLEHKL